MTLRGVNLGGWLLLEKWITPSLFEGLQAQDEYSFCQETAGVDRLRQHRSTYITKSDFVWLAKHGTDAVRIPVGYWALENDPPFVNCREYLDLAFQWAGETGLKIVLDLHGAPGSQNGHDHSGKIGPVGWTADGNIQRTLDVLGQLARRYGRHDSLWGIELLNEPGWDVPHDQLREFYTKAYRLVREYCDENVAVILSDAFRPQDWNGFMTAPRFKNVVLDMHLYQCFTPEDAAMSLDEHVEKTRREWSRLIRQSDKPVMIGEWSLGLDPATFADMDEDEGLKIYAQAQLETFAGSAGWFFWNYKTENMRGWNWRRLINESVIK